MSIATKPRKRRVTTFDALAMSLTIVLGALFGFPLYWAFASSLMKGNQINLVPPLWYPPEPQWQNFVEVGRVVPFFMFMKNTAVVTILNTIGGVISASLVGYGFSFFQFRGRNILFMMLLSTMMLPSEVTLIPTYMVFNLMGWVDTIKPLVIPAYFGGGAFAVFLYRQFFSSIPKDLNDAAKIDGCGPIRFYIVILMPLSVPVILTLSILTFQSSWNDLMGPLIYLVNLEKFTVSLGLLFLRTTQLSAMALGGMPMDHLLMAGTVMAMFPCLIVFFTLQRYFVRGVIMTGIKG